MADFTRIYVWGGASGGDFNDFHNWTPVFQDEVPPTADDLVIFNSGGTVAVDGHNSIVAEIDVVLGTTLMISNGLEGDGPTHGVGLMVDSDATVIVSGSGSVTDVVAVDVIGFNGAGTLKVNAGGTMDDSGLVLGDRASGVGNLVIDGSGSLLLVAAGLPGSPNGQLIVGNAGTGAVTVQNAGTLMDADAVVGKMAGSNGTVTLNDANWTSGLLTIGQGGTGTVFVQAGGILTNAGMVINASGTLSVSASLVGTPGTVTTSSITLSGGTLDVSQGGIFALGATTGPTGAVLIESSNTFVGLGMLNGNVVLHPLGVLLADGATPGMLTVTGDISGSGTLEPLMTLDLKGAVAAGVNIVFQAATPQTPGVLVLDDSTEEDGTISGFAVGNTIFLTGLHFTTAFFTAGTQATHGVLTLTGGGETPLDLPVDGNYAPGDFSATPSASGTTIILAPGDNIFSDVNFTLPDGVHNLTLTGSGSTSGAGNSLDNHITGNSGDNVLTGSGGNDTLFGGAGIDTAVYSAARSSYTITKAGLNTTVSGLDGNDTLSNIEWLQFSDGLMKIGGTPAVDSGGDGKSDILWHSNSDGSTVLWQMNGTQMTANTSLGAIPVSWNIIDAHGDYNGDGKSDILWRDSTNGTTVVWQMNGNQIDTSASLGTVPTNWNIVDAHGDYNGDGKSDILWRDGSNGMTVIWQMNGTQIDVSAGLFAVPTNWNIIDGHGDYNGDGKSDLLWRESTNGTTVIWQMNGTQITSAVSLGTPPTNWGIVDAHGDYNGDGKSDILWRESTNGTTVLWQMNGTQVDSAVNLGTPPTNWGIVDAHGDYNGDGKSDILWRDSTSGTTVLWQMNGTQIDSSTNLGAIPTNWSVVDGHGDYNGDGKSDILWRNSSDGTVVLWQMNGNQIATSGALGTPPANSGVVDGTEAGAALTGDSSNNTLLGTVENDTLTGLAGNDTLTGGAGADKFVFNTALNASTNVDTITDFASGTDKLVLDHLIFSALSAGSVAAGNFVAEASATAHDANDYVLYDTATGNISYDPDGSGALAATQFASLANHPAIAAVDLTVV